MIYNGRAMTREPDSTGRAGAAPAGGGAVAGRRSGVVLVTGMSGAGRTSALKALEDIGYEAIDNLPLSLLGSLVRPGDADHPAVAIGIDIRTRDFGVQEVLDHVDSLMARADLDVRLLFLDCDDEVLRRRFTETRRRHPLAADRPVTDGIRHERRMLHRLKDRADTVIDTSDLTLGALRARLRDRFGGDLRPGVLQAFVTSFAFRFGLPRDADLVFDVRFLANPYYEESLRDLSGRDPEVAAFIAADPDFAPFFEGLTGWLLPLLPRFEREGKSYLTLAVGCTGGCHRSVYVAERLAERLRAAGHPVTVRHRDVERRAEAN